MPPWTMVAAGLAAIFAIVAAYLFAAVPSETRDLSGLRGDPERGAYVLRLGGCVACHSGAEGSGGFLAGGAPIVTPFGAFAGPNITPHDDYGIGGWTLDAFADALTNGRSPSGASYYPVFPYTSYTLMSDQDIVDLWAYMQTVEPVASASPRHEIAFPFNIRMLLRPWKTLFFDPGAFTAEPDRSGAGDRGASGFSVPGHWRQRPTPRAVLGGSDESRRLEGSDTGPDGEKVPAITREALERNGWTAPVLAFSLSFGIMADGDAFGGSMGEVVEDSTKYLTEADRMAIAAYLLDETGSDQPSGP